MSPALRVERLKALELVSEIIAWKLRLFVPLGEGASRMVSKLFDALRWPWHVWTSDNRGRRLIRR